MTNRAKAYVALMTTTIIWGIAPPIIKYSLNFTNPIEFLFYRFLIVSLCVLPIFVYQYRKQPFKLKDLPILILVALSGTSLTLGLLFWGLSLTSSLDSSVIAATCPLMIVLTGVIFLKETITKKEKWGLILAFLGTSVAVISPLMNGSKMLSSQNMLGNLLIFLSNISWTYYSIVSKKISAKYKSFQITAFSFFIGLLTFAPLFFVTKSLHPTPYTLLPNYPALLGILYMSFLGSLIGYFTYTYGFSLIEASEATMFSYLQPIFTIPLAFFWLKEELSLSFVFGAGLILIGVFLTEYKKKIKVLVDH